VPATLVFFQSKALREELYCCGVCIFIRHDSRQVEVQQRCNPFRVVCLPHRQTKSTLFPDSGLLTPPLLITPQRGSSPFFYFPPLHRNDSGSPHEVDMRTPQAFLLIAMFGSVAKTNFTFPNAKFGLNKWPWLTLK